jgi:hypothetical protein
MDDTSNNTGNSTSDNNSSNQGQTQTPAPTPQVERPSTNTTIQTHSDQRDYETKKKGDK